MRVKFLTPVRHDLLRAVRYLEEASPSAAARFLDEVDEAKDLIAEFPRLGAPATRGTRRVQLHSFPYSLVYRIDDEAIRVFAVRHHSRDPQYWESRL